MNKEFQISALVIVAAIAITLMVPFIILLGFLLRNKQIIFIKEKQRRENEYEQAILSSQIEIQKKTLQNVSDEIHDNIGQLLSIVTMKLNIIEEYRTLNPHLELIVEVNSLVAQITTELRNLAKGLNPEFISKYGFIKCVHFELDRLKGHGEIMTKLSVSGIPSRLDLSKEFILYRILQESLTNIIRHANASMITISLDYEAKYLNCKVADNGCGFLLDEKNLLSLDQTGSGLLNIKRRIHLIGGECHINSEVGRGTIMQFKVPIENL